MSNLNRIAKLHELPESHPIAQRERISLAHIDVAGGLKRSHANQAKEAAKARKVGLDAAAAFEVGQTVRTRLGQTGIITAINDTRISVDVAGTVKVFTAATLTAA